MLSRTAIDNIGARLRNDSADMAALAELALFRNQVANRTQGAFDAVVAHTTSLASARNGKSNRSIIEKLLRQKSLKLSQMQDVEGCRVIVDSLIEQDALASRLHAVFNEVAVYDRRASPSYGYRALHLVPRLMGERYEIQIRTRLQHAWAEVAERLAGRFGQALKYGGGDDFLRNVLSEYSTEIAQIEIEESIIFAAWTGRELTNEELDIIVRSYPRDEEDAPEDQAALVSAIHDNYDDPAIQRQLYRKVLDHKQSSQQSLLEILRGT